MALTIYTAEALNKLPFLASSEVHNTDIDEFLDFRSKTQFDQIKLIKYERSFKGFRKAIVPFDVVSKCSIAFTYAFATLTFDSNENLQLKYDEVLDNGKQDQLISSTVKNLLDYTKSRL